MARQVKLHIDRNKTHMSKRQLELREQLTPVCTLKDFSPPPDLSDKEIEVWDWLVEIIEQTVNNKISAADRHLMQLYCRAKVATDEADAALKENPDAYIVVDTGMVDKSGQPKTQLKPNPYRKIRSDNAALCIKLFDRLGLDPIARAKVGSAEAKAQSDLDTFKELMNRSDD